jgi:hypothetical protein
MAKKNNLQDALQGFSEQEAKRLLEKEGKRLERIALKLWRRDMSKYQPKSYAVHLGMQEGQRTNRSQKAIKLGRVKMISPTQWGIELTWENELVYHDSMFPNQPKGHSVMLISDGWHSKKLEGRFGKIYRFTYFEGTNYIGRVIKEWQKSAPKEITLEKQWSGAYTK